MNTQSVAYTTIPDRRAAVPTAGILRFPTAACAGNPHQCSMCHDCADDCTDCETCLRGECELCAAPDLTPRTAQMLLIAGRALADEVQRVTLHGPRPVFLYHIARTLDPLTESLEHGDRPWPHTMAQQLCLHLTISHARELACALGEQHVLNLPRSDYDYDFDRLYDTLLPDDEHEVLVEMGESLTRTGESFNFIALGDLLTQSAISTLFAPRETGHRIA